jgi:predicted xylose isomerase-like sugar epimerase
LHRRHSRTLQAGRIRTWTCSLVHVSGATQIHENLFASKPFSILVDLQDRLDGFEKLRRLASSEDLIVPGH